MQVVALETNQLVRWRAAGSDLSDWSGTQVEFEILPRNGRTYVHFRHSGYREGVEGFPYYSMSWAAFLISLKEFLEKGKGHPFPNDWISQ